MAPKGLPLHVVQERHYSKAKGDVKEEFKVRDKVGPSLLDFMD